MNNIYGLTDEDVKEYRKKYGKNVFTKRKKVTIFSLIIESLNDPIVKILLLALGIKMLLIVNKTDLYETLGIAIAVFLASFISVISEYGSEKAFERLSEENNLINVKVIRNSIKQVINIEETVVNDIIILESGDRVPADAVVLSGEIYVDESSLTGESKEKIKSIGDNIYMGSLITSKQAICRVINVGDNTSYGKIAYSIQEHKSESPLKLRLKKLAKNISLFGYIGAAIVFISYILNSVVIPSNYTNFYSEILYALTLSVAVVVMAVPEDCLQNATRVI